jgi:hypothetical protein
VKEYDVSAPGVRLRIKTTNGGACHTSCAGLRVATLECAHFGKLRREFQCGPGSIVSAPACVNLRGSK